MNIYFDISWLCLVNRVVLQELEYRLLFYLWRCIPFFLCNKEVDFHSNLREFINYNPFCLEKLLFPVTVEYRRFCSIVPLRRFLCIDSAVYFFPILPLCIFIFAFQELVDLWVFFLIEFLASVTLLSFRFSSSSTYRVPTKLDIESILHSMTGFTTHILQRNGST